jgi:prepilin-type N-terminal cleavage/methylation domain-containing protein
LRRSRSGFSLAELLVVAALFSVFLSVSYVILKNGMESWHRTESSQDVGFELAQASYWLQSDLSTTSVDMLRTTVDGNVLWFLSPIDPATDEMGRKDDGTVLWQRNIIYFLTVPQDHDQLFGLSCEGQDTRCPHKFLVRRVFDRGSVTNLDSSPANEEKLMSEAEVSRFTGRPKGYGLDFGHAASESDKLVARGLLEFEVRNQPDAYVGEIEVRLSGFDVNEAGKKIALGRTPLEDSPYTHDLLFSSFPGNR